MLALKKVWRFLRWPLGVALIVYLGFVLAEVNWPVSKAKSDAAVAAIHAQRLTMKDVDGSNLPPEPDPAKVDATVEGIDANANGIRDDVELAIFDKYPTDIKVRAAALQYAMALQLYVTTVFNAETWLAAVEQKSMAQSCIFFSSEPNSASRRAHQDFSFDKVINSRARERALAHSDDFAAVFSVPEGEPCHVRGN